MNISLPDAENSMSMEINSVSVCLMPLRDKLLPLQKNPNTISPRSKGNDERTRIRKLLHQSTLH
jgi:hypothetical protein